MKSLYSYFENQSPHKESSVTIPIEYLYLNEICVTISIEYLYLNEIFVTISVEHLYLNEICVFLACVKA